MHWANHLVSEPLRLCRWAIKKCRTLVGAGASLYIVQPRSYLFSPRFFSLSLRSIAAPANALAVAFRTSYVTLIRPWTSPWIRGHWYTRCHPRASSIKSDATLTWLSRRKFNMRDWKNNSKLFEGWRINNRV